MKIIITSDIHINDYKKYERYVGYREQQFYDLAKRLIEEAKIQNTKLLIIAGDIIDYPVSKPKVVYILNNFLNILKEYFDKIYFIYGNHDCDTRDNNNFNHSSYLITMIDNKFIYMNDKYLELNNRLIYFLDYQYKDHIEPKECDIFISHIRVDKKFGQTINNTKFKLGIFGDIHLPLDIDNYYTISTPLQRDFRDYYIGYIGILDLEDISYKRVLTDSENYKFLKVRASTDLDINTISDKENLFIVDSKKIEATRDLVLNNNKYTLNKINNSKILEIIDNEVSNKYKDIHVIIKSKLKSSDINNDINLDFRIKSIKINNFRSIDSLEYKFENKQNIYFVTGENGSGKTSFLRALYLSLYSDKELKSNKKLNAMGAVSTQIVFDYENKEYQIIRSEGKLKIYENNIDITPSHKSTTEKYLYDLFPFMNLLYIFYIQGSESFFEKINNIDIFNKLFNISYLGKFNELSNELYKEKNNEVSLINNEINKIKGAIDIIRSDIDNINHELLRFTNITIIDDIDSKINELNNKILIYKNKKEQLNNCITFLKNNQISEFTDNINDLVNQQKELNEILVKLESDKVNLNYKLDKINDFTKEKLNILNWIKAVNIVEIDYNKADRILHSIHDKINNIKIKINNLENIIDKNIIVECPKCSNKFNPNDAIDKTYINNQIEFNKKILNKYIKYYTNIKKLINNHNESIKIKEQLKIKQARLDSINEILDGNKINDLYDNIKIINDKILNISQQVQIINDKIKKSKLLVEIELKSKEQKELNEWFNNNIEPNYGLLNKLNEQKELISKQKFYTTLKNNKEELLREETKKLEIQNNKCKGLLNELTLITEYKSLFDFNHEGSIPQKIFDYLSNTISDDQIKFTTFYSRNKLHINCSLKVDNEWIAYDSLSMGQQSLVDILLIKKLNYFLGRIGILFLDEVLSHLDFDNYEEVKNNLKELDINNIFITSHLDKFTLFTKKIEFKRVNNTTTLLNPVSIK